MSKKNSEISLGNGLTVVVKETSPAPRYTEATLIKKLESSGVGRP